MLIFKANRVTNSRYLLEEIKSAFPNNQKQSNSEGGFFKLFTITVHALLLNLKTVIFQ